MFRITKLTDYAVVLMSGMARGGGTRSAQQIAADTGLPPPTAAKVMKLLVREGLLTSERGAAGGYRLARGAEAITMADVVQAIEGPIALTACAGGGNDDCSIEGQCPMHGRWRRINQAVRAALSRVTLAEMAFDGVLEGGDD